MPISQPTFQPDVGVGAINKNIQNVTMAVASTEYTVSLPSNLKSLILRARGNAELRMAFGAGETATKYFTIKGNCVLSLSGLDLPAGDIYLRSNKASTEVEVIELYS